MLKESGVQTIISQNLALIIENYFAKLDILQCTDRILVKRAQKRTGLNKVEKSLMKPLNRSFINDSSEGGSSSRKHEEDGITTPKSSMSR